MAARPARTLESMDSTGSSEIQRILAEALADRPYSHRQDVDPTVAAVITVESDRRFLPDTVEAVLRQTVLPCTIVIVDCAGDLTQPMTTGFEVIPSPSGPLEIVPESKTVDIRLIPVTGAASFADAVARGMVRARLPHTVRAWWMLHDDSRPADADCLAHLLDAWRNNPTASLLGAKQLDWDATRLHDVGRYAGHHRLESLVVDGEEDQEQYDSRQDVFAVSLAGALLPTDTVRAVEGVNRWFTTFGESADFCRRICLDGGRVVVVPAARIAHRRARFDGIRTRNGHPVADDERTNPALAVMVAEQRYLYTDYGMPLWIWLWLWRWIRSFGMAVAQLFSKRPYAAGCELLLPWLALGSLPRAVRARRLVARHANVPMSRLSMLSVNRQQLAQWKDRAQALEDQRHTILLSPLAKAHLRARRLKRWGLACAMALAAFIVVAVTYRGSLAAIFAGGSLYSDQLLPTAATMRQLADAATTPWVFGVGTGIPAPPAPWLMVWLVVSVFTAGHTAAALSLMFLAAAPLAAFSFWALAGIFTRSDGVRVSTSLLWVAFGMAMGLFDTADLPMLTVMVFLPAAFAFAFRAVAMYRTEDQLHPHRSVQSAALASLCFIPVVAAEPQLLLPLVGVFLVFLTFVRRHRVMLLLMPVPAAFVIAPTLVNSVRYASEGAWRQLFGDVTMPSGVLDGQPGATNLLDVIDRAFGGRLSAVTAMRWPDGVAAGLIIIVLAVVSLLAVIALFLPFVLRVSRMMWITAIAGGLLAMCCTRIVVATDASGDVAASVLPGVMLMMLGLCSCVCMVAGAAVKRFVPLRVAADEPETRVRKSASRRAGLARAGRVLLVVMISACTVAVAGIALHVNDHRSVGASDAGLPMVAVDYLQQSPDHRVLALRAGANNSIEYTVMRTRRGDLVDSSPAQRVRLALGESTDVDAVIAKAAASLLAGTDAQAIQDISRLGFGGLYVAADQSDAVSQRLISNITASDGTQSVVASAAGTYYRLTITSADSQNIDTSWQRRTQSSPWRYAWLWCAGVIIALYCLVALPHRTYRYLEEES
ncbi:hypothetical protein DSM100688_1580 [Bifidobacterium ramosum]|uniref:Glycosyltransferase 2-like domain-containing protein n=2 Tax=Bifidobacterium ramosum TaxID=1798158 RepID=A0A6L4WYV5_9BIFI|nr:hypothetical protein DSM100688_1580 [Bifidobacterium ramosum]